MNDPISYIPKLKGAKALGATEIRVVDACGGYNEGPHEYEATLPNGKTIDSISCYGNPMGLETFKKVIKKHYKDMIEEANK